MSWLNHDDGGQIKLWSKIRKRTCIFSCPVRCCFVLFFCEHVGMSRSSVCYMCVCVEVTVYVNPDGGTPAIKLGTCFLYSVMCHSGHRPGTYSSCSEERGVVKTV